MLLWLNSDEHIPPIGTRILVRFRNKVTEEYLLGIGLVVEAESRVLDINFSAARYLDPDSPAVWCLRDQYYWKPFDQFN